MSTRSLNKVMLIGNLTRDPELRYTPSGTAVCSFSVATNRSWTPSDGGERREETEFHRIVAWNKLAELCSQLLTKGRKVYVEGRLQTRSWETPDGNKRFATEVVAEDMVILDSRRPDGEKPESEDKDEAKVKETDKEPEVKGKGEAVKVEEKISKKTDKGEEEKAKPDEENKEEDKEIDVDDIPF
ncbi:single-stranded DNA-binding protein [Patescibacteria group bacterium]|nr:single-stranded DNA-binding protein [Patescibacteria group bacterium]